MFSVMAINAQTLRTYNGDKVGEFAVGKVSYSYYFDDQGNEVKHGIYKFIEKASNSKTKGTYIGTLTGSFNKGLKDGIWTYVVTMIDYPTGSTYTTSNMNMKHSYKKGLPNGNWIYSDTGKHRKILYSTTGWKWSNYEIYKPESAQINWKDGILVGTFTVNANYQNIKGQLNNEGFFIGKWIDDDIENNYMTNGLLIESIYKSETNQLTSKKYNDEISLYDKYISLTKNEQNDFLFKHRIKIDTIKNANKSNIKIFNKNVFRINSSSEDDILISKIDYGKYVRILKLKQVPLENLLNKYRINLDFITSEELQTFFDEYKSSLSDDDISKFESLINKSNIKSKKAKEEKEFSKSYKELYTQLVQRTYIDKQSCSKLEAYNIKKIRDIDDIMRSLSKGLSNIDCVQKYFSSNKYKISDFSEDGYNPDYDKHVINTDMLNNNSKPIITKTESFERLTEYMKYIQDKQQGKELVLDLLCLPEEIRINAYKVDKLYVKNMDDLNYDGSWYNPFPKKVKKSKLYNPYFESIQHMTDNIRWNGTFDDIYTSMFNINKLCLFMLNIEQNKTGEIEKELNSTKSVENRIEIFKKYIK